MAKLSKMSFFRGRRLRLGALIAFVLALAVGVINLLGSASVVNDLVAGTGFPGEFIADLRAFGSKRAILVLLFTLALVAGGAFWARSREP